jgi:hypothetical protein
MTKKDYILIAKEIKKHKNTNLSPELVINMFITIFQKDNPRFDKEKFINYINS